jgi:hypothetical protein
VEWFHDDGGRYAAGFRGETGDCVTRAIAIAAKMPYRMVYDDLNRFCKSRHRYGHRNGNSRTGIFKPEIRAYMASIGWVWTPTMGIGTGCRVHLVADELPAGRLVVNVSKHSVAVIDGVAYDTYDPTRDGTRCVYGYYQRDVG